MRKLALALGLVLAWAAGPAHVHAQGYSPAARQVIERARMATGGGGWNQLRGWRETGQDGGLRYEAWLDPIRYGRRVETHEPDGLHVRGFNGMADWRRLPSGATNGRDDPAALAKARSEAFFHGAFYFFPGRYDARGRYVGVRTSQGRAYEVLDIRPYGGEPRELWFDRASRRLARVIDRTGPAPVTVELSDYRKVGPVSLPFRYTTTTGAGPPRLRQVESLVFTPTDRDMFSLPRRPPPAPIAAAPPVQAAPPPRRSRREVRGRPPIFEVPKPR